MIDVSSVAEQAGIGRFVPTESAIRRSDVQLNPKNWNGLLQELTGKVDRADSQANIARHRKWLTNMRFFMGEQLGYVDPAGSWQTITRNPGDPIYVINILQYLVNALLKDYVRSQAILDVTARGGRLDMRLAARPAAEMLKIIQQDQMGATAIERDGKFVIIYGNTFRYTVCTANSGKYRKEPVTEKVRIQLSGSSAVCLECAQVSEMPNLPESVGQGDSVGPQQCPQCGSSALEIVQGAETDVTKIKGFENRQTPDVATSIVDPLEIKLPISAENEILAGWLRRERYVDKSKLDVAFPWAQLVESMSLNTGEVPLLAQQMIQQSPGNVGGYVSAYQTSPAQQDLRKFKQYWYRPEEYAHFIWSEDEVQANGETIPKGTRAIELFPNGLYVAKCGETVLEVAPENKADVWVHNRWEVVPNAIWGMGIDHVIQGQEMQNEVFSLVYEHIMHNTTPPVVLDPNFLDRARWSNKPGMVAVLKRGAPTGGVGAAFAVAQGRPVGNDTFGFLEMLKGDMQLLAGGAFSTASGLPDVHTNTLGGMQIQRDQALAQHVSKLNRKAEADVKTGKQQLRIVKQHNLAQFYFERLSDFSEYELMMFDKCDIDLDLEVKSRQGSWIPRSVLEQRSDLESALVMGAVPFGIFNPQVPRIVRQMGLELLGLPSLTEQMGADERNTLLNIVHLLELARISEVTSQIDETGQPMSEPSQPNPEEMLMLAANTAPVRYRVDDHPVCIETVIEFLKTDAGRHLSPLAELLLNDLITRHKMAMQMQMMEEMASNPMAMNPMTPNAAPATQDPAMAQPMPSPRPGAPQQQMASPMGNQLSNKKSDATPQGNKPTAQGL